ncbi:hypothetical protein VBD025_02750 [Virgibacillus flavescens]|uniref:hypothetical protein n=1 Tax=Virgibacillus flavescens TaxID=1611422 RepID=UPI003D32DBD8
MRINYTCNFVKYNDYPEEGFKDSVGLIFEFDVAVEIVHSLFNKLFPSLIPLPLKPIQALENLGLKGNYYASGFQVDSVALIILADTEFELVSRDYSIKGLITKDMLWKYRYNSLLDLDKTDLLYHAIFTTNEKKPGKSRDIYFGSIDIVKI